MAAVKPFICIRPSESAAAQVAALPYDVYSREEACRAVAGRPLSFLNIDRAETQFPAEVDTYDPKVYEKARELLDARIAGRPFLVNEYASVYWNRYRYEEPFAVSAYAAFQGFDMVLRHGSPIHVVNGVAVIDYDKCVNCKLCTKVCPRDAITPVATAEEKAKYKEIKKAQAEKAKAAAEASAQA